MIVSLIWFIYDFSAYSFTLYSSSWIATILGDSAPLWRSIAYGNVVVNLFYIPGSFAGAILADLINPKRTLIIGVIAQGIVGFIMSGTYKYLSRPENVGGFIVIFGVFLR